MATYVTFSNCLGKNSSPLTCWLIMNDSLASLGPDWGYLLFLGSSFPFTMNISEEKTNKMCGQFVSLLLLFSSLWIVFGKDPRNITSIAIYWIWLKGIKLVTSRNEKWCEKSVILCEIRSTDAYIIGSVLGLASHNSQLFTSYFLSSWFYWLFMRRLCKYARFDGSCGIILWPIRGLRKIWLVYSVFLM